MLNERCLLSVRSGVSLIQPVTYVTISNLEKEKEKFELQKEGIKLFDYLKYLYSLHTRYLSYIWQNYGFLRCYVCYLN